MRPEPSNPDHDTLTKLGTKENQGERTLRDSIIVLSCKIVHGRTFSLGRNVRRLGRNVRAAYVLAWGETYAVWGEKYAVWGETYAGVSLAGAYVSPQEKRTAWMGACVSPQQKRSGGVRFSPGETYAGRRSN